MDGPERIGTWCKKTAGEQVIRTRFNDYVGGKQKEIKKPTVIYLHGMSIFFVPEHEHKSMISVFSESLGRSGTEGSRQMGPVLCPRRAKRIMRLQVKRGGGYVDRLPPPFRYIGMLHPRRMAYCPPPDHPKSLPLYSESKHVVLLRNSPKRLGVKVCKPF